MTDDTDKLSPLLRWREKTLQPAVARQPLRKGGDLRLSDGAAVADLYTDADLPPQPAEERIGFPGEYPFTRGVQPSMYRGRHWTMRQYAGFGTAEQTNARFKYLLEQGQTGLSVAFDLPTQMGYDSDSPRAMGEVGRVGVAIDSLEDAAILFDGIPLDQVSTSMTINATAAVLLAFYVAVARRQGVAPSALRGTIQNDVLKEYVARGTYIFPPEPSLRIITDIFAYCQAELPQWNTISISGYHIREAGADAVQEVAFTLANAVTYVQTAIDAGLDVDNFAGRLTFFFGVHNNFLEEIAKFRAARRCWARLMRTRFRAKDPRSWMLRFHTQTDGVTLTAQQPDNNVVRVALQALAAVLGGTQSLHTNSRDEALALPSQAAALTALRTQQIVAYESGVAGFVDPLGGSYAIEALTDHIERRVFAYLDRIAEQGGTVKAIENGFIKREIADTAYRYQMDVEAGRQVVVGVNRFQQEEPEPGELLRVDPQIESQQKRRLEKWRAGRDAGRVEAVLQRVEQAARGTTNLMPLLIEGAEVGATLGEMTDALRRVYGSHRETVVI